MASYTALPEPMLARSGPLPTRGDFAFELKRDGFRALVSTERGLRVRSRRGWNMTDQLAFSPTCPCGALLDGELVALDENGKPDFPLLCERVLFGHSGVAVTYIVFDVLSIVGERVIALPHAKRRELLEQLNPNGPRWRTPDVFDDGEALFAAVCEHELEGVVAKRRSGRYLPGERGWIKTRNRCHWRYELERESARARAAPASSSDHPARA